MSEQRDLRKRLSSLYQVAQFQPRVAFAILALSVVVGALEGVGLGFILPIIEVARTGGSELSGPVRIFEQFYAAIGVPFTLEYIIGGVTVVIGVRYLADFVRGWLTARLRVNYVCHLRRTAFDSVLDAKIEYFDREGSDDIMNAIVTQTQYAGQTIHSLVRILELSLISAAYVLIALYLAPYLMIVTALGVGVVIYASRRGFESGYSVGDRAADANERVQSAVQAGTQGIRDVKLYGLADRLEREFGTAIEQYLEANVTRFRNQQAIRNTNEFATAAVVFLLVYAGLEFSALTLGGLGVFLFAIFRLGPKVSNLNDTIYNLENDLPHLFRMHEFVDHLENHQESPGNRHIQSPISRVEFDDVSFTYDSADEPVLSGVSFEMAGDDFVAFVGPSGGGKSTVISLLARMYDPDDGQIRANGVDISEFDLREWRDSIAVVRQDPFMFNETLRFNVTLDSDVSEAEMQRVCEIAGVTAFLEDLPQSYDTVLGDDGVRLSGGQKQRVAIARALLKDADLLVLDEATSALDSHLEEQVHQAIESMDRDYGIVAIAHRLSTITDADRIHVVEDGRIIECGRHHELVEQGGTYADLYTTQSRVA